MPTKFLRVGHVCASARPPQRALCCSSRILEPAASAWPSPHRQVPPVAARRCRLPTRGGRGPRSPCPLERLVHLVPQTRGSMLPQRHRDGHAAGTCTVCHRVIRCCMPFATRRWWLLSARGNFRIALCLHCLPPLHSQQPHPLVCVWCDYSWWRNATLKRLFPLRLLLQLLWLQLLVLSLRRGDAATFWLTETKHAKRKKRALHCKVDEPTSFEATCM